MATISPVPGPRTRTGCMSCRVRHLKCDENRPVCRRCRLANRECVRGYNVRFRYGTDLGETLPAGGRAAGGKGGEFRFQADQVWIGVPGEVSFVDETRDITRNYGRGKSPSPISTSASPAARMGSNRPVSIRSLISPPPLTSPVNDGFRIADGWRDSTVYSPTDEPVLPKELNPVPLEDYPRDTLRRVPLEGILSAPGTLPRHVVMNSPLSRHASPGIFNNHFDENSGEIRSLHLKHTMWPLKNEREARLLRHYISEMGKWFDMHDNLNHFQAVVPLKSATCPMLMNAMLALAARQLSHTSDYDPLIANHYQESCLASYIPALSSVRTDHLDPSLLAATVLLRTFEELDVAQAGRDEEHYLLGGSSIFSTLYPSLAISGGLRQACFWIFLRQDIYMAFTNQRPVRTNLDNLQLDRTFSPADDCTWANRITFKCAEILHFVFGPPEPPPARAVAWQRLMDDVSTWYKTRPDGFEMIYYITRDPIRGRWFPEIWYTLDCHATGAQYYHLCRILLALYNPSPASRPAGEVIENVRAICGIAKSNRPVPAWFTACHAVYVCGIWFEDEGERRAMLQLLRKTERRTGWPTAKARRDLRENWGMADEREEDEE